ncbi:hypothetical protein [Maribacter sp. 2304DJ31-5]|uniref:hypothetical protein n=1 Tax=Maribacter sp. 2304DJ31-5 TaxID=3386273 RepID=UPI0039BC6962
MKEFLSRIFWQDFVLSILILLSPLLFYLYLFFDENLSYFFILNYKHYHGFIDNQIFAWYFLIKLLGIVLCSFWFFNFPRKIKYFVLIPIFFWTNSLILVLFENSDLKNLYSIFSAVLTILILLSINAYKVKKGMSIPPKSLNFYNNRSILFKSIDSKIFNNKVLSKDLRHLIHLKDYIDSLLDEDKKANSTILFPKWLDFMTVIGLLIFPFLYFGHSLIPDNLLKTSILGIVLKPFGFYDIDDFIWFLSQKICLLIPTILWFLNSIQWWRYAIFSPIIIFSFQIWEIFQSNDFVDEVSLSSSIPFISIILIVLLIISKLRFKKIRILSLYQQICSQIEKLIVQETKNSNFNLGKVKVLGNKTNLQSLINYKNEVEMKIAELEQYN